MLKNDFAALFIRVGFCFDILPDKLLYISLHTGLLIKVSNDISIGIDIQFQTVPADIGFLLCRFPDRFRQRHNFTPFTRVTRLSMQEL